MSQILKDFILSNKQQLPSGSWLLYFNTTDNSDLPQIQPGQFVEVKIDDAPAAMLRRPISVCQVIDNRTLVLLVKPVGQGTRHLTDYAVGRKVNILLPLGHGFTVEGCADKKCLLVGGGVGAAPLAMLSQVLTDNGANVTIAIGGRSASDVEGLEQLYSATEIALSTDDGSCGAPGVVTANPVFEKDWDFIYCCGPTPMMKAVGRIARDREISCEVSLENHMACGLGACLCCVEKTDDHGNVCVCTEGPVFNIKRLNSWL